jgi:LysR family glycine cleavage system transcriptional activator
MLEEAAQSLRRDDRRRTLVVSACGGLVNSWLLPRLGTFRARHPDIDLRLESTSRIVDLATEPVDVALRPLKDADSPLVADLFLKAHLMPVAHPDLLAAGPPIRTARDVLAYTLLQDGSHLSWPAWLQGHGVQDRPPAWDRYSTTLAGGAGSPAPARPGARLDIYIRDELESGDLVPVLGLSWCGSFGYYHVSHPLSARLRRWGLPGMAHRGGSRLSSSIAFDAMNAPVITRADRQATSVGERDARSP